MTQLIYTANTCNFYFHLTLRKSVTNSEQRTADSTVYRVAAQLISVVLLNTDLQKLYILFVLFQFWLLTQVKRKLFESVWQMKNTIKWLLLELNCSLGELCCISLASRTGLVHFPDWPNWRTSNLFVSLIEILHHNHLNNPDWQENVKSG